MSALRLLVLKGLKEEEQTNSKITRNWKEDENQANNNNPSTGIWAKRTGAPTDQDHEIPKLDIPEWFQLWQIPVTRTRGEGNDRTTDNEMDQEAEWIYSHTFFRPFISNQVRAGSFFLVCQVIDGEWVLDVKAVWLIMCPPLPILVVDFNGLNGESASPLHDLTTHEYCFEVQEGRVEVRMRSRHPWPDEEIHMWGALHCFLQEGGGATWAEYSWPVEGVPVEWKDRWTYIVNSVGAYWYGLLYWLIYYIWY